MRCVTRARELLLLGSLVATLGGCARTTPVVAPTTLVVSGVDADKLDVSGSSTRSTEIWQEREHVDVEWRGSWFPAVILERRGSRYLVHYEGYSEDWDELVGAERIRARSSTPEPDEEPEEPDEP